MTVNPTQTPTRPDLGPRPEQQTAIAGTRPRRSASAGEVAPAYLRTQAAALAGFEPHLAGENVFTHGLLHERELHRAGRLEADARQVWRRASHRRYRRWMK